MRYLQKVVDNTNIMTAKEDSIISVSKALSEALGLDSQQPQGETQVASVSPSVPRPIESEDPIPGDAEYVRQNLFQLIEEGTKAIASAQQMLFESQHPRVIEVLAQLLKVQAENVEKLMALHGDVKELNKVDGYDTPAQVSVTNSNVVFAGTSNDLVRMLRREREPSKVLDIEVDSNDTTTSSEITNT